MRKIRIRKHINKAIVRRINNFFDSAVYRNKWGNVSVLNTGEIFNAEEYLRFYAAFSHDRKTYLFDIPLPNAHNIMSLVADLWSLAQEPVAIERNNKLYFGVRFERWVGHFSYSGVKKGDTIYIHYCPNKEMKYEVLQCRGCGRPIVDEDYIETADTNHMYCSGCEGDYYYECDECGEYFDSECYEAENDSDRHICYSGFDWVSHEPDSWYRCGECDDVHYGEGTWVHNRYGDEVIVCDSCRDYYYHYCEDCEEWHHENNTRYVDSRDGYVCDECVDDHYIECDGCGRLFREDDDLMHYDEDEERSYCENCWHNHGRNRFTGEVIRRYHGGRDDSGDDVGDYDMDFLVSEKRYINPTIGTELEADEGGKDDDNAREILQTLGENYCIASEDASLDDGFEIVSCPADLHHHKNTINWEEALAKLRELGYKSHDCGTCGIHTHIDRDFFEDEEKNEVDSKFIVTLQNNFWWLKKFSRRDDANGTWEYCDLNTNNYLHANDKFDKESIKNKQFIEDNKTPRWCHRLSVNVTHTNTVEIRLYRGTLIYETFIATIECSDLWARLVKGKTIEESVDIDLKDFVSLAEKLEYKEFLSYLNKRNISVDAEPKRRIVRFRNSEDYIYLNY